jgi:uncharacterized protein YjcR
VAIGAAAAGDGRAPARRSFSARARQAVFLQAHGHSRREIAPLIGVAPETISVWRRHPQWQRELERWRALAEAPWSWGSRSCSASRSRQQAKRSTSCV